MATTNIDASQDVDNGDSGTCSCPDDCWVMTHINGLPHVICERCASVCPVGRQGFKAGDTVMVAEDIEVEDVLYLAIGSPALTVISIDGDNIECRWFGVGGPQTDVFSPTLLRRTNHS